MSLITKLLIGLFLSTAIYLIYRTIRKEAEHCCEDNFCNQEKKVCTHIKEKGKNWEKGNE